MYLKRLGYDFLIVVDDLPFVTDEHVVDFCKITRKYDMEFRTNLRANLVTERTAELLASSGCSRVQMGVESASNKLLDSINKKFHIDIAGRAIEILQSRGIPVKAMFIVGLPGEKKEDAYAIVDFVRKYQPAMIQISIFTPLPKSPLWNAGWGRKVADYYCLSFFGNKARTAGVGNEHMDAEELIKLRREIIQECQKYTTLDLGVPEAQHSKDPDSQASR